MMNTINLLLVMLVASVMNNNVYAANVRGQDLNCEDGDDMFALTGGACFNGKDTKATLSTSKVATSYSVLFYGSSSGYMNNRAQIQLSSGSGTVAWIRFKDENQEWDDDYEQDGIIRMHMPSHMFPNIIDMLKNASYINIYMAQNRAFLGIS